MADTKLSALTALAGTATAPGDLFYIDDVSATTAGSKSLRADGALTGITNATVLPSGAVIENALVINNIGNTRRLTIDCDSGGTGLMRMSTSAGQIYFAPVNGAWAMGAAFTDFGGRTTITPGGTAHQDRGFVVDSTGVFGFGDGVASSTPDAALTRSAAGVVKVTNGSTGLGTLTAGTLIAQQSAGTPGTDQVEISHDGTLGSVVCKDGILQLTSPGSAGAPVAGQMINVTGTLGYNGIGVALGGTQSAAIWSQGIVLGSASYIGFTPAGADPQTEDVKIVRLAAGQLKLTDGSTGGGALVLQEITEPSNPASDLGVLFVKDNGGGKSQLCVRFASGVTQVIATEP